MKIYMEVSLYDFEAWSGGADTLNRVIDADKVEELENLLEELYPEGLSDTELNDILWFEEDWVYEILGIRTESEIRAEIESVQEEMDELMENFDEECEAEELNEDQKNALWNGAYRLDYETMEEHIAELEAEIDKW